MTGASSSTNGPSSWGSKRLARKRADHYPAAPVSRQRPPATTALYYTPAEVTIHKQASFRMSNSKCRKATSANCSTRCANRLLTTRASGAARTTAPSPATPPRRAASKTRNSSAVEILREDPVFENLIIKYHRDIRRPRWPRRKKEAGGVSGGPGRGPAGRDFEPETPPVRIAAHAARQSSQRYDAARVVSAAVHALRRGRRAGVVRETKVLCTASVEDRVPAFLRETGSGWITAEYAMLPRSTHTRTSRDSLSAGRAKEISRLIGRSLRNVVDLSFLGERQITLDCDVIQADGGTRTAAITGAYVAVHDAIRHLLDTGGIAKSPLLGQCAALSVGIVDGETRLDLCYEEDVAADVDMNLVCRSDGNLIEVQATAEGEAFPRERFQGLLDLACAGCERLFALQREALQLG